MDSSEKLSFFHELINCNYTLYCWEYDRNFALVHTNYTENLFADGFLIYTGLSRLIDDYLSAGKTMPAFLEVPGNLLWICGFELREAPPDCRIHLVGPFFSGRDSQPLVKKRMDTHNLSVKVRAAIMKNFESIPALPSNIAIQYAVMLHYCLNRDKVSGSDIAYLCTEEITRRNISSQDTHNYTGMWYAEQQLCKLFAEGNPDYKNILSHSSSLNFGIKAEYGDALRVHKNNSLILLTLCSRSCILGGLQPSIAYELFDHYAQLIERCTSMTATARVCDKMLEEYITCVQEAGRQTGISASIENSCKYIKAHLNSPLPLSELANRAGYTEYYFSHKFKKETGDSVTDFILKEKIKQARLMLEGTSDSIQSISDALAFGNRSYFYACFRKQVGISPSEYRKKYGKL